MNVSTMAQAGPAESSGGLGLRSSAVYSLVLVLLTYLPLVSFLRRRREQHMRLELGYTTRDSLKNMTNDDAFAIQNVVAELEFPWVFDMSLQFALFKSYGLGTIASLLVDTRQLTTAENATKRYADTVVLLKEFMAHAPTSERTLTAIARMNYLHGLYQKPGKIHAGDMLYTLSAFITEPIAWIKLCEWRELNDMEICAIGTFWKAIGDGMGIDYAELPSSSTGWRDGLQFYHEIKEWAQRYEQAYMLPNEHSRKVADHITEILLWHVPPSLKKTAETAFTVLMDDRLRRAMKYPPPSNAYKVAVHGIITARKLLLRHLSLPRPTFLQVHDTAVEADPKTGRYHLKSWQAQPWYVPKTARWGLQGWLTRLLPNGVLPGDDGDRYVSDGYRIEDVGPRAFVGKGLETIKAEKERLRGTRTAGCPFG